MQIIGGTLKKRRLLTPEDHRIRPISSKLQAAIFDFSFMQVHIHNAQVLDLFSGTGVLGLEALSRGAAYTIFVDSDALLTKHNIQKCGCTIKTQVIEKNWEEAIQLLYKQKKVFSLIFIDPPYDFENYAQIIEAIEEKELLETHGFICIKHWTKNMMKDEYQTVSIKRHKKYGSTALTFYTKKGSV